MRRLLEDANAEARVYGEEKSDVRFLNVLSGLEKLIPAMEEATENLGLCLRAWDEGTLEMPTLVLCAKTFVLAVTKALVLARIIDVEYQYADAVSELLVEVSTSSRFLAACLSPDDDEDFSHHPLDNRLTNITGHQKSVSHGVIN